MSKKTTTKKATVKTSVKEKTVKIKFQGQTIEQTESEYLSAKKYYGENYPGELIPE